MFIAITLLILEVRRSSLDSEELLSISFKNMLFKAQENKDKKLFLDPKQTVENDPVVNKQAAQQPIAIKLLDRKII